MAELQINVTLPHIPLLRVGGATPILRQEVGRAIQVLVEEIATNVREAAPVATGNLRASVGTEVTPGTDASILVRGQAFTGKQAPYAEFVSTGTRPHFPPIAPLKIWARIVLGDEKAAWRVARAIAKRGTKANARFAKAIATFPPDTQSRIEAAVGRAAARLTAEG